MNNTEYISKNEMKIPKFNGDICDFPRLKNDFMMYVMHLSKSGDCAAYVLWSCLNGELNTFVKNVEDISSNVYILRHLRTGWKIW